jgi:hypothetical protein
MSTKTVMIGTPNGQPGGWCEYAEYAAQENVTPKMAAMPFGPNNYGKKKAPTPWVVRYMGRERRIYCDAAGNAGACYVLVKGEKHFVH